MDFVSFLIHLQKKKFKKILNFRDDTWRGLEEIKKVN